MNAAWCSFLGGIDRQTHPGLLSDTLIPDAANMVSVFVSTHAPTGRKLLSRRLTATALTLLMCCTVLHAWQVKPGKHVNRHEIDQLEEAWRRAVLKSDTAGMSKLLADDYIAITASGTLQTKEEALANLRSRRFHLTSLIVSDRKVRFYGKTALVTSLAEVQGTTPDGDVSGDFRYTRVYARDAQGQWKIVSFEASRIRPGGGYRPVK